MTMPSLRTAVSKWLYFGLVGHCTGGFMGAINRQLRSMRRLQWQSVEQIRQRQLARLQTLLAHATRHVPYYRNLHSRGLMPDHLDCLEQMASLPVLSRETVATEPEALLADNIDRALLLPKRSGGTSGRALNFYVTPESSLMSSVFENWGAELAGYRPGDAIVVLWGSRWDITAATSLRQRVVRYVGNCDTLISNCMDEPCMERMARHLAAVRPALLVGYTTALVELARFLSSRGIAPNYPRRGIIAAAEPLSPAQREQIQNIYGKPVFNRYGGRESGPVAIECDRHKGLHINCENAYLDLEPCPGAECAKRILITKLREFGMPFIRYDVGDYTNGELTQCTCGRGLPIMEQVCGRQVSMLRRRDGTITPGLPVMAMLDYLPVRQYRIVQEEDYTVRLELVPEAGFNQATREKIIASLRSMIYDLPVQIELKQSIERTESGKLPPMISRVKAKGPLQAAAASTAS